MSSLLSKIKSLFTKDKTTENIDILAKEYETQAHTLSLTELEKTFETNCKNGLTNQQAAQKSQTFGLNQLTPPKTTPLFIKFLITTFLDLFNGLLWFGAILCAISYALNKALENLYLAAVLLGVVLITGAFTTYQDYSSSKIMKGFLNFLPPKVNCLRNGKITEIEAINIVPGDLMLLKAGDKVPADCRVVQCSLDAHVDNSSLTGECDPQHRVAEPCDDDPMEANNLCFFGTLFVQGKARCLVINTGDNTLMGGIAQLAAKTKNEKTPIGIEINHFVKIISLIAVLLGVGLGVANYIINRQILNTIVFVIGIIVANVPEGLLATLTVSLTLAAKRMSTKSVLVKNLEGVETLGSTSVICSDKTGTLTTNKMTVSHLYYDQKERAINTSDPSLGEFDSANDEGFHRLVRCATLCNGANYKDDGTILGDASETALLRFSKVHLGGESIDVYRKNRDKAHNIPFNSKNKWQLSIHKVRSSNSDSLNYESSHLVAMKGAPERILEFCDKIVINGKVEPMDSNHRQAIEKGLLSFAQQGERVLAFCDMPLDFKKFPENFVFKGDSPKNANFPFSSSLQNNKSDGNGNVNDDNDDNNNDGNKNNINNSDGYIFIGLAAMIDPPRPGVPSSVKKCQSAGIKVFMVTGDHPTTARAIAKKVNIINADDTVLDLSELGPNVSLDTLESSEYKAIVVTGKHIASFTTENTSANNITRFWNGVLKHPHVVFSRTSPQQKLLIVEACQLRNSIVAVTGDGVNDSPALKKADIGIAMGITGTDVAKDAADMILLDDNFSSIVNGVEEGRILFDNLKKSIAYTLSSNIPEISPFIFSFLIGLPLPLKTIQIFTIDLGTDMVPAISMAYERKESDIMNCEPRDPKTGRLVTRILVCFSYLMIGVMQMLAGFFTYLCVFHFYKFGFRDLIRLDKSADFESCDSAVKYLTCYGEKIVLGDGEKGNDYCKYTMNQVVVDGKQQMQRVVNMECEERKRILAEANASYVMSIVVVQISDVMISKTRRNSIFSQGMGNKLMNIGILLEILLACFLIYTPGVSGVFNFFRVQWFFWILPLPFFMLIFGFDELRKLLIRKNFYGWVKRNTYW